MNAAANARWYRAIHKMTNIIWKRAFKYSNHLKIGSKSL